MIWILSRSTSSWSLVRDWAGTPPESPTKSSTLRPAMVALCSLRYCPSARSMSIPPEASGPVFTVIRPRRMGPLCACTHAGSAEALNPAPAAWMNRLRLNVMVLLLCSVRSVGGRFRGIRLFEGLRSIESVDFHAFPENAHGYRYARGVDIEELRPEDLGNQADVGDRRRIAVAEPARFAYLAHMGVERLVFLGVRLSLHQIDRDLLGVDCCQRESGAQLVGRERAPEPVEFHRHRMLLLQRFGGTTGVRT